MRWTHIRALCKIMNDCHWCERRFIAVVVGLYNTYMLLQLNYCLPAELVG